MPKKYTAISIFSGAMGLDIGIEETGRFKLLAALDNDPASCATIRLNRNAGRLANKRLRVYEEDITRVDPLRILADCGLEPGELDLLVGGPPCQTFSTAGRRETVRDLRGMLIWQFLRFVKVMRPKMFLMENVRGLLSAAIAHRPIKRRPEHGGLPLGPEERPGSVVKLFAEDFGKLGYRFDCFEVNAVNYGAPQLRERVLFMGNRFGSVVDFPDPTHGPVNGDELQTGLFDNGNSELHSFRTLGDAIRGLKEERPILLDFSPRKKQYLELIPPGGNWRALPERHQKESMGKAYYAKGGRSGWWRRLSYDLPCPTIVTMPNHAGTALCHPEDVRVLSVRECALVQEFSQDWEFVGTPQQQYTQVGNAVPVRLGLVAGQVIADHLNVLARRGWKTTQLPSSFLASRILYIKSHVRTRQWFKKGRTFIWRDGDENRHVQYRAPKAHRALKVLG